MRVFAALCLTSVLIPGAAPAISPEEVRDLLLSHRGADGVSVTVGSERRDGDTLVLSDVIVQFSDVRSSVSQALAELRLRDTGGGGVEVTASPEASLVGRIEDGDLSGTLRQTGLRLQFEGPAASPDARVAIDRLEVGLAVTAGGTFPGRTTIEAALEGLAAAVGLDDGLPVATTLRVDRITARAGLAEAGKSGEIEATLANLSVGHRLILPPDLRAAILAGPEGAEAVRDPGMLGGASLSLTLGVGEVAAQAQARGDEGFRLAASTRSEGLTAALAARAGDGPVAAGSLPGMSLDLSLAVGPGRVGIDMAEPGANQAIRLASETAGATVEMAASVPAGLRPADFEAGPPRSLSARLAAAETAGASEFDIAAPGAPAASGHSRHEGARFEILLDGSGLRTALALAGIDYALASADLPVPVTFSAPELALSFVLPVHRSPGPQPADLRIDLRDLRVSEGLWSVFDPQAILPRDPIRLTLDAGALLTVIGDVFDPAAQDTVPYRADRVVLRDLVLSGLGVAISGSGDALLRYPAGPDMPEPDGAFRFRASGLYALMGRAQTLGLVSGDEMAGLRMGLAMIAKPAGDDVLTSDIRLGPGGSVILNGMKVK